MAEDTVEVDPSAVVDIADQTLTATMDYSDCWIDAMAGVAIPASAFGVLGSGARLAAAQFAVAERLGTANSNLAYHYGCDVDKLYRAAALYVAEDQAARSRIADVADPEPPR